MLVRLVAVLAALAAPALGLAQYDPRYPPPPPGAQKRDPAERGLLLGGRVGWGSPSGDISQSDFALGDIVESKIPFWLELGYRFNPRVWGNLYLELAPVSLDSAFCGGGSCNGSNARFGVDVQYHFASRSSLDPWLGLGVGIEVLNAELCFDEDGDGFCVAGEPITDWSYAGWEFPVLQAGLDVAVSPRFSVGPFVSYSLGRYTSQSVKIPGNGTRSDRITDRDQHAWLELGLKGTFKL